MATITINGNIVEPAAQCEGGHQYISNASQSNYILLHVNQLLGPEQHAELERRQVRLQQYTGANTYICYYRPPDLDRIRELDFVDYANVYHPDLVIEDLLRAKCGINAPSAEYSTLQDPSARARREAPSDVVVDVLIMLHEDPERSPDQLGQALVSQLHLDPATVEASESRLRISKVDARTIQEIALFDEVKSIQEVAYAVPQNHVARQDLDFVDYTALDASIDRADYDADNIIVAVGDTGFDLGNIGESHPVFQDRVTTLINEGGDFSNLFCADKWGHGTHVCGSVAANYPSSQFGLIRGTAPGAELAVQAMALSNGKITTPFGELFWQHAFDTGACIHNNSWGTDLEIDPADKDKRKQRGYDLDGVAGDVDKFMRCHEEFLVVFCAGNQGQWAKVTDTKATINAEAAAKNCLTVGACESSKSMDYAQEGKPTYFYNEKGSVMGNKNYVPTFSSIGPTKNTLVLPNTNSRIKPDVVAPGTIIYSAKSRFTPLKWHHDPETGIFQSDDFDGDSTDDLFAFLSGTSMAAPLVSGCAAVLRKILLKRASPGSKVTAALIKALIINGAVDLVDIYQSRGPQVNRVPDNAQGFGRVNITASIRNITDSVHCGYHQGAPLAQGKSTSYPINIPKAPQDYLKIVLKATMCYNDVGGSTDLVNVLNLKATQEQGNPGSVVTKVKYGNTQSNQADGLNNVQKVIWHDIHSGPAVLTVECAAIRMPGTAANQDFALAWSIEYVDVRLQNLKILGWGALGAVAAAALLAYIIKETSRKNERGPVRDAF